MVVYYFFLAKFEVLKCFVAYFAVLVIALSCCFSPAVVALEKPNYDALCTRGYDCSFFDPEFKGSCEVGSTTDTEGSAQKNKEIIWDYFIAKGLSPVQTAGIMGNMHRESGFYPTRIQGKDPSDGSKDPSDAGSGGWGLIQWTPGSKVIKAAEGAGLQDRPIYELGTQLDLVWGHMQNKPPITKGSFSVDEFKKINDLRAAIEYFEDKIEGAGVKAITERVAAAKLIMQEFEDRTASVTIENGEEASTCISESSDDAQSVSADGYALPVTKKGMNLPCNKSTCHHDGTPASDLGIAPKWEGTPVYAIVDGEISNYKYRPGFGKTAPAPEICKSFQLVGKDGWQYWYGHIMNVTVKNGSKVKAGQKIAEIGPVRCADDTPPHLHIDRGTPKGAPGGSEDRRDPGFIPLLNKIYESTP